MVGVADCDGRTKGEIGRVVLLDWPLRTSSVMRIACAAGHRRQPAKVRGGGDRGARRFLAEILMTVIYRPALNKIG